MSKLFYENSEGKKHYDMKMKLFDLIIEKNVKIVDDYNAEYEIYTKKHKNEFLHIESFIIKPEQEDRYVNSVFFSNENLPCSKYLGFDTNNNGLLCDLKGYCGAIEKLPCNKCLEINLDKKQKNDISIGFTPDISFGYDGKHIVWLEVLNTSPCSPYKIKFCQDNNIELLEISVTDIDRFKSGRMIFNNLTKKVNKTGEKEFLSKVLEQINKKGYYLKTDFNMDYHKILYPVFAEEYHIKFDQFLSTYNLSLLEKYDEKIKKLLNIEIDGLKHLIISDSFEQKVLEATQYLNANIEECAFNRIVDIFHDITKQINESGFIRSNSIKNKLFKEFKIFEVEKEEFEKLWLDFLKKNNLFEDKSRRSIVILRNKND